MRDETTVIAEGVRFIGDIAGDGNVEVYGKLEGAVHIGGELRIAPEGVARVDVVAARVRVDGRLEGRVRATQQVAIGGEGVLVGQVQGLLAVEEGGLFQGRVEVEAPDPAAMTMEAPPVAQSQPGRAPQRLERHEQPARRPHLRLPEKRRSATSPSADREAVITRKMPQVRGDGSHPQLAVQAHQPQRHPPAAAASRPIPARPTDRRTPAGAPAAAPSPPRPEQHTTAPARRIVTPPHPSRTGRRSPGGPGAEDRRHGPRPGDPVMDREDLSDEWFEEDDYLLKDR